MISFEHQEQIKEQIKKWRQYFAIKYLVDFKQQEKRTMGKYIIRKHELQFQNDLATLNLQGDTHRVIDFYHEDGKYFVDVESDTDSDSTIEKIFKLVTHNEYFDLPGRSGPFGGSHYCMTTRVGSNGRYSLYFIA